MTARSAEHHTRSARRRREAVDRYFTTGVICTATICHVPVVLAQTVVTP
jgi:hypothetical protein